MSWSRFVLICHSIALAELLFSACVSGGWVLNSMSVCQDINHNMISCSIPSVRVVAALEILGFIFIVISLLVDLCANMADSQAGRNTVHGIVFVLSMIAGWLIIVGIIVYNSKLNMSFSIGSAFSCAVAYMSGVVMIIGGIFAIVAICSKDSGGKSFQHDMGNRNP